MLFQLLVGRNSNAYQYYAENKGQAVNKWAFISNTRRIIQYIYEDADTDFSVEAGAGWLATCHNTTLVDKCLVIRSASM